MKLTVDANNAETAENKALVEASNRDFSGTEKEAEHVACNVEKLDDEEDHDRRAGLYGPEYPGEKF